MDKAHQQTDLKLDAIEKHLTEVYNRAGKEIEKTAKAYFDKFAELDAKKLKLVDDGKLSEDEYLTWRKNKILYGNRYKYMREEVAAQLLNVNKTATAYINGEMADIYTINYNSFPDIVEGDLKGYSLTLTDASTVKNLAMSDKTLLPYRTVDGVKDVRWNTKKINSEVLQGILQGDSMDKIAKRFQGVTEMNKTSAIRNARTSVTSAENKGRFDSFTKAEEDGIILKKKWISSNQPKRTREWHMPGAFEKLVVDRDKPFVNGAGPIMYPGDPNARPENVYNCRCTMGAKVEGFAEGAKVKETPAEEVKEKKEFKPALSIKEAEEFISKYCDTSRFGATGVSYTGIDVEVANAINKTFYNFFETYDVGKIGGIIAPAGNTKEGKLINSAIAAYSPIRNSFLINRKSLKNLKTANKSFKAEKEVLQNLFEHPENYDFSKMRKSVRETIERARVSGRATVPDNIEDVIHHELGHFLEKKISKEDWTKLKSNMSKYSDNISGYAGENMSEYVAESFASFMKGENKTDPELIKIFKMLKR